MHWQDACDKSDLNIAFRVDDITTMFKHADGYGTIKRGNLPLREAKYDEIDGWMDWTPYILEE